MSTDYFYAVLERKKYFANMNQNGRCFQTALPPLTGKTGWIQYKFFHILHHTTEVEA